MDSNKARQILSQIERKKVLLDIEDKDIASYLGICEKTLKTKLKEPGKFSLREIYQIMHLLRFSKEERIEALL